MSSQKNIKRFVVVILGVVYFISFWLLTIGYFTPYWILVNLSSGKFDYDWRRHNPLPYYVYTTPYWSAGSSCNSIGLVKPTHNCDSKVFDWFEEDNVHGIGHIVKYAFILMTTAVVVVYTNAMMLGLAIVFDLLQHTVFISLLSISFGVFYPVAAILILVATIYVEVSYKFDTGFSTMLCTIAGCLMLFFSFGLILYDQMYMKQILMPKGKVKKSKQGTAERVARDKAFIIAGKRRLYSIYETVRK